MFCFVLNVQRYLTPNYSYPLTEREKIFAMCKQTEPIPIADVFTKTYVGVCLMVRVRYLVQNRAYLVVVTLYSHILSSVVYFI